MQSPLGKLMSQSFGTVNFSIRYCQVFVCHNQNVCALTLTLVMCMLCLCYLEVQNKLVDFCSGIVYDTATSSILVTPFEIPKTQPMRRWLLPGVPWVVVRVAQTTQGDGGTKHHAMYRDKYHRRTSVSSGQVGPNSRPWPSSF